jgi:hypothetical protein
MSGLDARRRVPRNDLAELERLADLMRSFASGIHYERRDGTNRLTMRFALARVRKTPTINLNAQARGRMPPARRSQNAPLLWDARQRHVFQNNSGPSKGLAGRPVAG